MKVYGRAPAGWEPRKPGGGESVDASVLLGIIADYLRDRDDVATAVVNPSDDADTVSAEVVTQGGKPHMVIVVGLRERG